MGDDGRVDVELRHELVRLFEEHQLTGLPLGQRGPVLRRRRPISPRLKQAAKKAHVHLSTKWQPGQTIPHGDTGNLMFPEYI